MERKLITALLFAAILMGAASSPVLATIITCQSTDMTSTQENLWQVDYQIDNYTLTIGQGFQVIFDYGLYENIQLVTAPANWTVVTWDPENILTVDETGALDAMLNEAVAGQKPVFSVQFLWKGTDTPAVQAFEMYDESFLVVETGMTQMIPEPATMILLAAGLPLLYRRKTV